MLRTAYAATYCVLRTAYSVATYVLLTLLFTAYYVLITLLRTYSVHCYVQTQGESRRGLPRRQVLLPLAHVSDKEQGPSENPKESAY